MSHVAHVGDVLAMHARMYSDKVGARDLEREMTFRIWYNRACRLANALLGIGLSKVIASVSSPTIASSGWKSTPPPPSRG